MSVRPPKLGRPVDFSAPLAALNYEILGEQASALGRAGDRLIRALAALEAGQGDASRAELLDEAGDALGCLVVQREASGLRMTEQVYREYRVPASVRACMGIRPQRRTGVERDRQPV